MATVAVYDITNNQVGDIELNDSIFGVEMNAGLLHQAVVMQLASERLGTHATKTRSFVRGGGRKPWKQKGTGRARSGSTRSPLWVGGGTVFGPHPRKYAFRMPRKQRRLAIACALSDKVRNGELVVLDSLGSLPSQLPHGRFCVRNTAELANIALFCSYKRAIAAFSGK